jgi:hypothetical protein
MYRGVGVHRGLNLINTNNTNTGPQNQNVTMANIETVLSNLVEAFPAVPRERIRVDLNITHSSEVTAERILSGSLG